MNREDKEEMTSNHNQIALKIAKHVFYNFPIAW